MPTGVFFFSLSFFFFFFFLVGRGGELFSRPSYRDEIHYSAGRSKDGL